MVSVCLILVIAVYLIGGALIRHNIKAAIKALPPEIQVSYEGLHPLIFQSALILKGLDIKIKNKDSLHLVIKEADLGGVSFLSWIFSKKLKLKSLKLVDATIEMGDSLPQMSNATLPFREADIQSLEWRNLTLLTQNLSAHGYVTLDSVRVDNNNSLTWSNYRITLGDLKYTAQKAFEKVHLQNLVLDSKTGTLTIDTAHFQPTVSKEALGKIKGHQEDYAEGTLEGIRATHMDLKMQKVEADSIKIETANIYVFRDRRLPLDTGNKPLPIDYLKGLPVNIRIRHLSWGPATFTYEEYPKQGDKTGYLKIERLRGQIQPFFNKPENGDPAYKKNLNAEGSLMGSGTVVTRVEMPMHGADPYKVQGAFRNLDLTSLNPSAVNLGDLRLESGMLNNLAFNFDMNGDKATGKVVGEYHDLVAAKLKGKAGKKEVCQPEDLLPAKAHSPWATLTITCRNPKGQGK